MENADNINQDASSASPSAFNQSSDAHRAQVLDRPVGDATAAAPGNEISATQEESSDEATTQQVLRFWNHPSLQQVPTDQKQAYLKHKGITEEQIFSAWDRIVESQSNYQKKKSSDWAPPYQSHPQQQPFGQPQQVPIPSSSLPYSTTHQPTPQPFASPTTIHNDFHRTNTSSYPPHYNDLEADDEGMYATPNLALIATVGGFLGLMAAATVRWLNGGDFLLFPLPARENHTKGRVLTLNHQSVGNQNETVVEEEEETNEEEEEDDDDLELEQYLSSSAQITPTESESQLMQQAIERLTDTFQQHATAQQKILQKLTVNLSGGASSNLTDLSMQALRNHKQQQNTPNGDSSSSLPDPMLWYKLVEIQVELASLKQDWGRSNKKSKDIEQRLGETLQQLQAILDELKPPQEITKTEKRDQTAAEGTGSTADHKASTTDSKEANAVKNNSALNDVAALPVEAEDQDVDEEKTSQPASVDGDTHPAVSETSTPAQKVAAPEDEKSKILRKVRTSIINLVRQNVGNVKALKAGTQILFLYVSNLSKNPHVPKYRKVFTSNQSFQKVEQLEGSRELLYAVGFVSSGDNRVLEWPPATEEGKNATKLTTQEKETLVQTYCLSEVAAALAILKSLKEDTASGENAALDLLEKTLDVLPCPPSPAAHEVQGVAQEASRSLQESTVPPTNETASKEGN